MKISILTLASQRDKLIDNILAAKLRKLGHEVNVRCYIYAGRESICYEKPDVVIHPMVGGQYKIDFVKKCKEWGIVVIVRRGEAGMGKEQFDNLDVDRKKLILGNWDYSPYVDLELVWGKEFLGILNKQGHNFVEREACGGFAFDPYFLKKNIPSANEKKTILFATGFSTADCRNDKCECGLPDESDYHNEIHTIHRVARDKWIVAINKLVRGLGTDSWDFGLKVRPGEMPREYIEKLLPAVKIHSIDSASSELLDSVDVLIHSGSTLSVEAHLSDVPAFNYCNVQPDPLLAKLHPCIDSYQSLEFNIARSVNRKSNIIESNYNKFVDHLYGPIDGKSCERAAHYVDEHIKNKKFHTKIPNKWPRETKYLDIDSNNIYIEETENAVRWFCPCCREPYWVRPEIEKANCPYCSMGIIKVPTGKMETVLK